MSERPSKPEPPWDGVAYVAAPDEDWRISNGYKACRFGAGGRGRALSGAGRKACGAPSVAMENRAWGRSTSTWAYCEEHMHARGHWIEDGVVMGWDLRQAGDDERSGQ